MPLVLSQDPNADNGQLISDAGKAGFAHPVFANGGLYRMKSPAILVGGPTGIESCRFNFQGPAPFGRIGRVTKPKNSGVVLLYSGDSDTPAFQSSVHGAVFEGVNLWNRFYENPRPTPYAKGIGWQFENPASSTVLRNGSVGGFERGIVFKESNHIEQFLIENYHFYDTRVCFSNEENQAVLHKFSGVYQNGMVETLFQFVDTPTNNGGGGDVKIENVVMQHPGLVLDIQKSNSNSCQFTIENLKIDAGNMNGWRLVRQRKGPLCLAVRGLIGKTQCEPAADAIDLVDSKHVDIEMWWSGRIWPHDFTVKDGKWVAK